MYAGRSLNTFVGSSTKYLLAHAGSKARVDMMDRFMVDLWPAERITSTVMFRRSEMTRSTRSAGWSKHDILVGSAHPDSLIRETVCLTSARKKRSSDLTLLGNHRLDHCRLDEDAHYHIHGFLER